MASAAEQLASHINFANFAKATELKKRIWFTLGALVIYRLGTYIPLPGIDPTILQDIFSQQAGGILDIFDTFAGGAFSRMTIFALNIMPYISAMIIMQLLTAVSPHFEKLKKEGEAGRKKMNQYTRYGTVLLAALQAYGISVGLEGRGRRGREGGRHYFIERAVAHHSGARGAGGRLTWHPLPNNWPRISTLPISRRPPSSRSGSGSRSERW